MSSLNERLAKAAMELGKLQVFIAQGQETLSAANERWGDVSLRHAQLSEAEDIPFAHRVRLAEANNKALSAYVGAAKRFSWSLESAIDQYESVLQELET